MTSEEKTKLSIVMPCYNCVTTLEESVNSVYRQNITEPYEVVMVDDGSTDSTGDLIKELATKHDNLRCITHGKNRGGGAARNTGIKAAAGELIFVLDSDDILPDGMLPKMTDWLEKNSCDGVIFAETLYFYGKITDRRKRKTAYNLDCGRPIVFSDLFNPAMGHLTVANFLFTKTSYLKTGGYPENHGFDTQAFGVDYLANNFRVQACPDSYYYHRKADKRSYFERIYENGEFSINYYLIYEKIIYLFSPDTIRAMMAYDIFGNSGLVQNLKTFLEDRFAAVPENFFRPEINSYLNDYGFDTFFKNHSQSSEEENIFCTAIYHYLNGNYRESMASYTALIESGINHKIIYFNLIRSLIGLAGKKSDTSPDAEALRLIGSLMLVKHRGRLDGPFAGIKNDLLNKFPKIFQLYGSTKNRFKR